MLWVVSGSDGPKNTSHPYVRNIKIAVPRDQLTHHIKPGSLVMLRHENLHRYEWPLGKVIRVFPDPSGIIRTAEVEEGGRCSLRPVTSLVPLELNCYDKEEGNLHETGREGDNDEAATSKDEELPYNDKSTISGHDSPITLGIDSASTGPLTRPQSPAADMQLSGLQETPISQSADHSISERDSQSPTHPNSVGATPNTLSTTGASGSQQPPSVS